MSALKPLPTLAATVSPVSDKKESISEVASAPLSEPTVSPVPTASPVPTQEPTPRPKGDIPERSYESIREFPYETMEFADEMTYAFIKQAYDAFAFDAEFKTGDPVLYDSYLDEFRKLVNNEMPFAVQGMQDSFYFKEYGGMEPAEDEEFKPDGLYHEYGLYHEIWNRNGEDRVHVRDDYHNWWFVNAQTLELVSWWMSNPEAEKEEDSVWENEKYFEIAEQLNLYG